MVLSSSTPLKLSFFFFFSPTSIVGVRHWICKDLRIGTVCISYKAGEDGTAHFLVRTVLVSRSPLHYLSLSLTTERLSFIINFLSLLEIRQHRPPRSRLFQRQLRPVPLVLRDIQKGRDDAHAPLCPAAVPRVDPGGRG